jgi:hypothetical protein
MRRLFSSFAAKVQVYDKIRNDWSYRRFIYFHFSVLTTFRYTQKYMETRFKQIS